MTAQCQKSSSAIVAMIVEIDSIDRCYCGKRSHRDRSAFCSGGKDASNRSDSIWKPS